MISIKTLGRFGNILHQYAYARLLAEETGFFFNWWTKDRLNSEYGKIIKEYFPQVTNVEGTKRRGRLKSITDRAIKCPIMELAPQLKELGRPLMLTGNFECYGFFTDEQQARVKNFMFCKQDLTDKVDDDDIVLHYRTGDMVNETGMSNGFLSPDYFDQALQGLKYKKLYIVTEKKSLENKDVLLAKFHHRHPVYINHEELIKDFNFIRLFKRIIMSQSSFSWWASLLSDATEIYYPKAYLGTWQCPEQRLPRDKRYIVVEETPLSCIKTQKLVIKFLCRELQKREHE